MSKHREFWITLNHFEDAGHAYIADPNLDWQIHVIEYSAYESALALLGEMREALSKWQNWEQRSIDKYGPYGNEETNEIIKQGREALTKLDAELEKMK